MVDQYSEMLTPDEAESIKEDLLAGKVSNQTFVELISQNIRNTMDISQDLVDSFPIEELMKWKAEDFISWNPFFGIGRLATEMENNMRLISILYPMYLEKDFEAIHVYCKALFSTYYSDVDNCKTGDLGSL